MEQNLILLVRSFKPRSFAVCKATLLNVDWSTLECLDGEAMAARFQHLLSDIFVRHFPEKTVRLRSSDPPWMPASLKAMYDVMERSYHLGPKAKYICLREKYLKAVEKAKMAFGNRSRGGNAAKNTWKYVNRCLGRSRKVGNLSAGQVVALNEEFCDNFLQSNCEFRLYTAFEPLECRLLPFEVELYIKKMKNCGPGEDGIPAIFFKMFGNILSEPVAMIFNTCLEESIFPSVWKKANVVPIPKNKKEFRPISTLPFLSKVFERIIRDQLLIPATRAALHPHQFAFVLLMHCSMFACSHWNICQGIVRVLSTCFPLTLPRPSIRLIIICFSCPSCINIVCLTGCCLWLDRF